MRDEANDKFVIFVDMIVELIVTLIGDKANGVI